MKKNKNGIVSMSEGELQEIIANAVAQALASQKAPNKGKGGAQPKVEYVNKKGEIKLVSEAQAKAWDAWKNREHKTLDEVKAEMDEKKKGYKPSKALIEAIKANRASITREVAVKQYGFVGTKHDLKELKDSICK